MDEKIVTDRRVAAVAPHHRPERRQAVVPREFSFPDEPNQRFFFDELVFGFSRGKDRG